MPPNHSQDDPYSDPEEDVSASSVERLEHRVLRTQEQLVELRRQQEAMERQKRDLEELTRRQQLLREGREEMAQNLAACLAAMDRETRALQKRIEQIADGRELLAQHLGALGEIDPSTWSPEEHARELQRALTLVETARADHQRLASRLADEGGAGAPGAYDGLFAGDSFLDWLRNGFAFNLPLIVLGTLALLALLLRT